MYEYRTPTGPEFDIDYDPSLLVSISEGMEDLKGSFEIALRKCMEKEHRGKIYAKRHI